MRRLGGRGGLLLALGAHTGNDGVDTRALL